MIIVMRKACECGGKSGKIVTKSGQDCVYCTTCDQWKYNAPKLETGRSARSVQAERSPIKPNQRIRVLERARCRCEICGKHAAQTATGLHVGHVVSVQEGRKASLPLSVIDSDDNLIAECDECNLGHGSRTLPIGVLIGILMARSK